MKILTTECGKCQCGVREHFIKNLDSNFRFINFLPAKERASFALAFSWDVPNSLLPLFDALKCGNRDYPLINRGSGMAIRKKLTTRVATLRVY